MLGKKIPSNVSALITRFQKELELLASPSKKKGMEKYMKHTMLYRGVQQPDINSLFKNVWTKENLVAISIEERLQVAESLMRSEYGEDKNIAIHIFHNAYKDVTGRFINDSIKKLFLEDKIRNWAVTDSLSCRFLHYWTLLSKENTELISAWRNEKDLWLQRASCIAFIKRAKFGDEKPNFQGFFDILKEVTGKVVKNPERFAQLGCGWLLREMSLYDLKYVISFIESNYNSFSREGLRYAIEKMSKKEQKRLLNYHEEVEGDSGLSEKSEDGNCEPVSEPKLEITKKTRTRR